MKHTPTPAEQAVLDTLLEQYRFEFVPIRLTETMLSKSIIDARTSLRALLRESGLVEFGAIGQGREHKVQASVTLVTDGGADMRTASFYRPETKQGDPRVWIERLKGVASPGDLLIFTLSHGNIAALLVRGESAKIIDHARGVLEYRYEERGEIERTIDRLSALIAPLRTEWITTMRPGPTGVGYTLESLLGIRANVDQKADVEGVELKAYRRGAVTGPGKLVTLFSKTPTWVLPGKGGGLLDKYGYQDEKGERRALYCTITHSTNTLGFSLRALADEGRMTVMHAGDRVLAYTFAVLQKRLREKHPATLFIKASSRGSGATEQFRYDEVTLYREPSFTNFIDLTEADLAGLDLTLSRKPNGAARDHGYLWRMREASIPDLFAYRRAIGPAAT